MRRSFSFSREAIRFALGVALMIGASGAQSADAEALAANFQALRDRLAHSPFGRPVLLQASSTANGLKGEVHAVVDRPMAEIAASLGRPEQWCEAMLLHVNNRACNVAEAASNPVITLSVVHRYDRPLDSAFKLAFDFHPIESTPRHLALRLDAARGPMGTSNYRIEFEAIPIDESRSFLHFSYAYDESTLTSIAMQAYLATFGRAKVGFTITGQKADGQPEYIRGMHGLIERNAMRYFLAVDAHLAGRDPLVRRNAWFSAIERYPRQLQEFDRETYLELKAVDGRR